MKYKGFIIEPVYSVCADWTLDKNNQVVSRKPKSADIEYYQVLDPIDNNSRFIAENTVRECKSEIDRILKVLGMKDNTKQSWDKLDTV
mgnify:FL=1